LEREILARLADHAVALSEARRKAAVRLTKELRRELEELGLNGAALAIGFSCDDDPAGIPASLPDYETTDSDESPESGTEVHNRAFTESGIDRVEFLASFNPGESPRALSAVASGGETSRFLLALASVLSAAAEPRTVVFDEVDEGVGGRAGSAVGEALGRLAARHQVFCITHLPQVAAFGDRHFVVTKQTSEGGTWSTVELVDGEQRLDELAAMLGSVTEATRTTAHELLEAAAHPALPGQGEKRRR
jgi:DNA repair protein RecN (Recombination protein N)